MPIIPKIPKRISLMKHCPLCDTDRMSEDFASTHSIFYPDRLLPICNQCISDYLKDEGFNWEVIDKLCQWADIPFIVSEWEKIREMSTDDTVWGTYAKVFKDDCYVDLGWGTYFQQYLKLRQAQQLEDTIPLIKDNFYEKLRERWGQNYDDEALNYLEDLYQGMQLTQNINGALQVDQARKICKLSYEIDRCIRAGDKDVDKFLSSYDRLVKTAEFTPKNSKNSQDFDSFAEVAAWLEKRGHINKFYDNVTRDVVDETLKNIENYNQRLYVNEGGVGEEITERLNALKNANDLDDNLFGIKSDYDLEAYNDAAFAKDEAEEFAPDAEEHKNE